MAATIGTSGFGTLIKRGDGGVGAGVQASKTIGTSNQQLKVLAKLAGTAGNSKTFGIVVSGNNTAYSQVITANSVLINSATDGGGLATTTVAQAISNLYVDATFDANFQATVGTGNGTGVLVAGAAAALSGGSDGAEVFTTVGEVTGISLNGRSLELIDATHMESPNTHREYLPSLLDSGELQMTVNFLPGTASQYGLETDRANRTKRNFQLVWTNTTTPNTYSFSGYVTGFDASAAIDDKLSGSVTIKITGPITAT